MEAVVLAMVCLSPWAFGAVDPEFEFLLLAGISVLLMLWSARMLLQWRVRWTTCPVAICLAAIVLLGVVQLTPLSKSWLRSVSPGTMREQGDFQLQAIHGCLTR